jgi:hypothetical protein
MGTNVNDNFPPGKLPQDSNDAEIKEVLEQYRDYSPREDTCIQCGFPMAACGTCSVCTNCGWSSGCGS